MTNDIAAIANSPGGKGMIGDLARKFPWHQRRGCRDPDRTRIPAGGRGQHAGLEGARKHRQHQGAADNGKDSGFVAKVDQASRLALNGMGPAREGGTCQRHRRRPALVHQPSRSVQRPDAAALVRIARDLGLSPFVTAGRTFNRLGVRAVKGAIGLDTGLADGEAASGSASAQLRLRQTAGAWWGPWLSRRSGTG